ncbi:MAG: Dph6-related ATP pyrophosphatase [Solirubrobacteraceae bacterium]
MAGVSLRRLTSANRATPTRIVSGTLSAQCSLAVRSHRCRHDDSAAAQTGHVPDIQPIPPTPRLEERCALSWSGGKDSALALSALAQRGARPSALITTVTECYERINVHGVRRELLLAQAGELGIPLVEVRIPPRCTNDLYEQRLAAAFRGPLLRDLDVVVFGDLFLADIRAYREQWLAGVGKAAQFPLWGLDTEELAGSFIDAGFDAIIVCVDPSRLERSFAGRSFDETLLADLPAAVDPCGENGEFHTFVRGGPVFDNPIDCRRGEVVERDGFVFCDLTNESR